MSVIIVCCGVPTQINSVVKEVQLRMSRNSRHTNHKIMFLLCYCFFIKTLTEWKPLVFMTLLKDGALRLVNSYYVHNTK